ncbi:hypothetical protein Ahy_B08g090352 [Arachis hypogaea]|uniref:Aminotransferase-like plant mobile domain-containing protein n=1 Tax=Arachis hypogaea TaxID=3818 RepID=A0A444Y036_ARAHY|nr:hypothetical protein Ahy_B08g090352 [Arachis hypogaea]
MTALIDRWRSDTQTFYLSVGECTISLDDVAHIYGLSNDGHAVSRRIDNCFAHLVNKCVANFGILPDKNDHVSSALKLSWIRHICDAEALDIIESVQCYIRCHIFLDWDNFIFRQVNIDGELQILALVVEFFENQVL